MAIREIKRYGNRKLYDTSTSRYTTLQEIAGFIRNGDEVRVRMHTTGADITTQTLTQTIFEEEKLQPRLDVNGLVKIIRSGAV